MSEAAFLADILENPDDDTPRLVLADWLEDNGRPERAAFLRCQLEADRLPDYHPRRRTLLDEAERLRRQHGPDWDRLLKELVTETSSRTADLFYRRGLPWRVRLSAERWLQAWPAMRPLAPLREVALSTGSTDPLRIASSEHLRQIAGLDLKANYLNEDGVRALAEFSPLENLISLDIGINLLLAAGVAALLKPGAFGNLANLGLSGNRLSPDGAQVLAARLPALRKLSSLDLESTDLGDAGVNALLEAEELPSLTSLNLDKNSIGPAGARALADSDLAARLSVLHLGNNSLENEGAEALAGFRGTPSVLGLRGNGIKARGARLLAQSPRMRKLAFLDLRYNGIGLDGARSLAESPHLGSLVALNLADNHVGDNGARALAGSATLAGLCSLGLRSNSIGPAGAQALAGSPYLQDILALDLRNNALGQGAQLLQARFGDWVLL
jgi:uncharacterized protein (TIGR02996 family)